MIGEIVVVTVIAGVVAVVGDKENWFGTNPEKLWLWQRPPFTPATARQGSFYPQQQFAGQMHPTGEQKIKIAQASIADSQRAIMAGIKEQQAEEARQTQGLSKYRVTGPVTSQ